MVVEVETREIALTVFQYHKNLVFCEEFTQQLSVLVVVQAVYIRVVPHLPTSESGVPVTLQSDTMDRKFRQQIAFRRASFDYHFREILVDENLLKFRIRIKGHLDDFRFTVGVGGEVHHFRSGRSLRQIVLLVAGDARHVETLDEAETLLAVAVNCVVGCASVVFLEDAEVEHILAYEQLLCYADNLIFSVFKEDDDIVEVGAVAHELVLFQSCTDESVSTVNVEFLVCLSHLRSFDGVEVADLCQARMVFAVLVLEELEPTGCHFCEVSQVSVYLLNLRLDAGHQLVGLVLAELQNTLHPDFQQFKDIVLRDFTDEGGVIGRQSFIDMFANGVEGRCLFKFLVLIDALFDEDFLQRLEVVLLQKFVLADFQLLTYKVLRAVCRMAQHIADSEEFRLVILDHATVRRDTYLAIGEGIEGINGLVRRDTWGQMHLYLHVGSRQVLYLPGLDLTFLNGTDNTIL